MAEIDYQQLASLILEQETSEKMHKIRQLILLRTALESDVKATRLPPPANITEVGGYYNLLVRQREQTMQRQLVASAVGLPTDYSPDIIQDTIAAMLKEILSE